MRVALATVSDAGRVTLVAGAGGQIGRAIVDAVAAREGAIALSDVDGDALAGLEAAHGERIVFSRTADLRNDVDTAELVSETIAATGRLDGCVLAFGIEGPIAAVEDLEMDAVHDLFDVNVFANIRLLKAVVPHMRDGGGGRIVTIASGAGLAGIELMGAYCSSKFAVVGLARSLAREVAADGIAVNAVCPGIVESPMMDRINRDIEDVAGTAVSFENMVPAGRYAAPTEIADLIAYLAVDAPTYLTGAAIVIDGALRA